MAKRKLSNVPLSEIMAELERRQSTLTNRREEIMSELAAIDADLEGFNGAGSSTSSGASARTKKKSGRKKTTTKKKRGAVGRPPTTKKKATTRKKSTRKKTRGGGGGGRRKSGTSLADMLAQALNGQQMSVREATDAVTKAGYKSKSKNLPTMVNIALIKDPRFKRVGRGVYTTR